MSKLLITGGHLTPALAFIDALRASHPEVAVVFVGREYAQRANQQPSGEEAAITARGLTFLPFTAQKTGDFHPLTFGQTVRAARAILIDQQIDLVLSFGGYLGVPFALAARGLDRPVITHEQTRVLGRANRLIALLADQTALSFPDTRRPWWLRRLTVTGNPLRESLFDASAPRPDWLTTTSDRPWLYIAGGSQGSRAINELVLPLLPQLTQDYVVIHQVGRASRAYQPLATIREFTAAHCPQLPDYFPREFLTEAELAYLLPRVRLAVSRAGANTLAELTAFRIPTLYIPLPFANYHEQERNAQSLLEREAALLLHQEDLRPLDLLAEINHLGDVAAKLRQNLRQIPTDRLASDRLWEIIEATLTDRARASTAPPDPEHISPARALGIFRQHQPPATGRSRLRQSADEAGGPSSS